MNHQLADISARRVQRVKLASAEMKRGGGGFPDSFGVPSVLYYRTGYRGKVLKITSIPLRIKEVADSTFT